MAMVLLKNPLAVVQHFPMQTIQTHAVIKAAVVGVHHVGEQISLVFSTFASPALSRRVLHLGAACYDHEDAQHYQPSKGSKRECPNLTGARLCTQHQSQRCG